MNELLKRIAFKKCTVTSPEDGETIAGKYQWLNIIYHGTLLCTININVNSEYLYKMWIY